MKNRWLAIFAVGVLLVTPGVAQAVVSFVYGNASNPICDDGPTRLVDATANYFMFHSGSITDNDDIIYSVRGGTVKRGAPSLTNGTLFWLNNNFNPAPGASEIVYAITTSYDAAALTAHAGVMSLDHMLATAASGRNQVVQPLPFEGRPVSFGNPGQGTTGGTVTGYDVRFLPVSEFDTTPDPNPIDTTPASCFKGATASPSYANRILAGYNIYRLNVATTPTNTSTPAHYLGGADGNFSTLADNGWVAFVSLNPTGGAIDLDAGSDVQTNSDLWGVEGGAIIYSDANHLPIAGGGAPNPKAPTAGVSYSYAFQPVVKVTSGATLAGFNGGTGVSDRDGDTRVDSVDLNGDTSPEFIDPSGNGLGLVFQDAAGVSLPLISTDSAATASQPLPSEGTLSFSGSFQGGVFRINFTSTLDGVAGYNIYRSAAPNAGSSFVRVNKSLILASPSQMGVYDYQDAVGQTARMARGVYYYKVEAVLLDGSIRTYGPYEVAFTGGTSTRGR